MGVWVASLLWLVSVGSGVLALALAQAIPDRPAVVFSSDPVSFLAAVTTAAAYATVSLVLAARRPTNPIGWLFAAIGVTAGVGSVFWALIVRALTAHPQAVETAQFFAWLDHVVVGPLWVFLATLLIVLFPDGRPPSPRWATVVWLAALNAVILAASLATAPGPLLLQLQLDNPFGLQGPAGAVAVTVRSASIWVAILLSIAAIVAVVHRYRRAGRVQRQQLKWFALGGSVLALVVVLVLLTPRAIFTPESRIATLVWLSFAAAASFLPVAAAIGILRYGLYEIDVILSRTFVYGSLTAILAGLYTASIKLFQELFVTVTGDTSDAAIVITTLVLATSFTPIKRRLEALVERRWREEPSADGSSTPDELLAPEAATATDDELRAEVRRIVQEELEATIGRVLREELRARERRASAAAEQIGSGRAKGT